MEVLWSRLRRGLIRTRIAAAKFSGAMNAVDDARSAMGHGANAGPMFDQSAEIDRAQSEEAVAALEARLHDPGQSESRS
ncbi:MAG TPA: hypothetical protein VG815_22300 [Chloroflexota bacterium]|jgi:hypothetical protein|nr:hypothetical protein [Chloroflexota bacterium]